MSGFGRVVRFPLSGPSRRSSPGERERNDVPGECAGVRPPSFCGRCYRRLGVRRDRESHCSG